MCLCMRVCVCVGRWVPEQLIHLWVWWFVCVQGRLLSVNCITPIFHRNRVRTAILSSLVTSECPLLHAHTHTHMHLHQRSKPSRSFHLYLYLHPVHSTVTHQQHQLPDTTYQERFGAFLIHLTLKTSFLSMKGDVSPMPKAGDGGELSAEVATGPAFHHRLLVIFPDRWVSSDPPGG